MYVGTVVVNGNIFKYGSISVLKTDKARIEELIQQNFWIGVEHGDFYSMLINLGPA